MSLQPTALNHKTYHRLAQASRIAGYSFVACLAVAGAFALLGCSSSEDGGNPALPPGQGHCGSACDPQAADGSNGAVELGNTKHFAILSKAGVDTIPASVIVGDVGVSPIDQTALTGFSETMDASNVFSTSPQVTGKLYAADYAPTTPTDMTAAIADMETAYTTVAGLVTPAPVTELGAGDLSGLTLAPGLYKFGTGVLVNTDLTLSGDGNFIFQIAQHFTLAPGVKIVLSNGAKAKNIVWQIFGPVELGTTSVMEGTILAKTNVSVGTLATVNGHIFAQTAVTLDQAIVTKK